MDAVTRVDAMIEGTDDTSSEEAVNQTVAAISLATDAVERDSRRRLSAELARAANQFHASFEEQQVALEAHSAVEAELKAMPKAGFVPLLLSLLYLIAACADFRTEDTLTGSLTYLLGVDPSGAAWMRIAFAAALLLFEFIIVRLRLHEDPWPFFRAAAQDAPRRAYWARIAAGAMIIAGLVVAGAVQVVSITKMAPTREEAGKLQQNMLNPDAPPQEVDEKLVRDDYIELFRA